MTRPHGDPLAGERRDLLRVLEENGIERGRAAILLGDEFALLAEAIPQLVWRSRDLGDWTWASRQWTAFTGQADADSRGSGWLDRIHPDDRGRTREAWAGAAGAGRLEVVHRIRDAPGAGHRWFETRAAFRAMPDGHREWFGTCTDVHDLHEALERQSSLLHELRHRVRNLLAGMRGVLRRTLEGSGTKEDFAAHLEARLAAMSRAQVAATRDPFARVDLARLVSGELMALLAKEGDGVRISGPAVSLSLKAAQALGLAFHELATNAVKFGTLGQPGHRLGVTWRVEGGAAATALALDWVEDAPGTGPPRREGFGLEMMRRRLPYELGCETRLDFSPAGLACRILLPLGEGIRLGAA